MKQLSFMFLALNEDTGYMLVNKSGIIDVLMELAIWWGIQSI